MSKLHLNLKQFRLPIWAEPLIIFLVCFFAYGVVIPWLGYYWDDWAFLFIRTQLGTEGLTRYFSTNRPFIAWIPQLTISLLGTVPWKWHVLMLFMRAASAISVWWVMRLVWHKAKDVALWIALLFAVYPGFDQQAIAINYTDFFLLFTFLMLSFSFSILAIRDKKHAWLYLLMAIPLAAYNHLALEYFFLLEFLRPVFIWFSLKEEGFNNSQKLKRVLLYWMPFLLVWLSALIWRFLIFDYQTNNYEIGLLDQFKAAPWATLRILIATVLKDIFKVTLGAWALSFNFPVFDKFGLRSTLLFGAVIFATLGITMAGVFWQKKNESVEKKKVAITLMLVGLWGMIIAGWPFWLTHLEIGLHFATSRFTLPFILGVSLFLVGLVRILPAYPAVSSAILATLISLAAGYQIQVAMDFRRDWNTQKNLFWQLAWRAPAIKSNTIIVSNDTPIQFSSDNSLVSPLNWMYSPDNHSDTLDYMFFYPSIRLETALKNLEPGMTIKKDYLAATFTGSTDQMIAMVYSPPGCVRILDPELDSVNQMLPLLIRQAASLSRVDLIQPIPTGVSAIPMAQIFGTEPPHGWCYYFEKADLARQQGDWIQVARLGDEAFAQEDYPNDPTERLVFIEGYAHTAQWEKSINLTNEANAITPLMQPVLCKLWQRIERDLGSDTIPVDTLSTLQRDLNCTP